MSRHLKVIVSYLLLFSTQCIAEPCSMIGCSGNIGYIYIPLPVDGTTEPIFTQNNELCNKDSKLSQFKNTSLPNVGSILKVDNRSDFYYSEDEITKNLGDFYVDISYTPRGCVVSPHFPRDVGMELDGNEVKIIGYRTFSTKDVKRVGYHPAFSDILFALIYVEK